MEMTIATLPAYRFAYVRQVGPYGPGNRLAMEQIKQLARDNGLLNETATLLGIPQDNPATSPPEHCRYDACIVLPHDVRLDDAVLEGVMTGGQYLIVVIDHTAEAIQQAWASIGPALARSGYRIDDKPILERYTWEMLERDRCEICVPVRPS